MPINILEGDGTDMRSELARCGLVIAPGRRARELLSAYLKVSEVRKRARCAERLGWHGGIFVMPTETLGETNEVTVFQNTHAVEPAFFAAGSVEDWRTHVASLAVGNARFVFVLSAAFAPVLLDISGETDGGGFHLRGASSTGKTTLLHAASSVWGDPTRYMRTWRATANGLEGLAALHNDGILILDEISQVDPRQAGEIAYMLANGSGKSRATRYGTARASAQWHLLFLSSGEQSLSALMAGVGKKASAGQAVRLADIEIDAGQGMGAFENLNGHASAAAFALAIKDAASRYYGAVGLQWLREIVRDREKIAAQIGEHINTFVSRVAAGIEAGQVTRVARRFALVACAGELATRYGLTGWAAGEATSAAKACFEAWLDGFGGAGNAETRAMLSQVKAFFEAHGSSRFQNRLAAIDDTRGVSNQAGFYEDRHGKRRYFVLPETYKNEICRGFDQKTVTRVLIDCEWLALGEPDKKGKRKAQRKE
jgi:uncharacterized protein (DUF927 family)